jgi:hypothetical protein
MPSPLSMRLHMPARIRLGAEVSNRKGIRCAADFMLAFLRLPEYY